MKSFYLSLYFSFGLLFAVDAQYDELQAFTNYGLCYQGLRTSKGEVIWPADFESLTKVWDYDYTAVPRAFFWVAEKNGSFGLIDHKGKLILPFNYNRITTFADGIVAADDNSTYLFSHQGEITWELKNYSWMIPTSTGYIVEQNNKVGFINLAHVEVLPTNYDRIHFCYIRHQQEGLYEIVSNHFLNVELNEKQGVFDLIQNKWVIPFTSLTIVPSWVTYDPNSDEQTNYFCSNSDAIFQLIDQKTGESKVINSQGSETLPIGKYSSDDFKLTPIDSCGMESHQMAYLEENKKMRVVNLKTGLASKEYSSIYPLEGRSIVFEDKEWGVLDTNFAELERFPYPKNFKKYVQFRADIPLRDLAEWRFEALFLYYQNTHSDSVLTFYDYLNEKEKDNHEYPLNQHCGLVNFRTGKEIKPSYHWISKIDFLGGSYYWALNYSSFDPEGPHVIKRFDIYNSDLKLLRRFDEGIQFVAASRVKENQNAIIILNDKAGVINPKGEFVIPLEFSEIIANEVQINDHSATKRTIFIARNDYQSTVFNLDGTVLIEKSNRNFKVERAFIHARREDHLTDLYNYEGRLIIEGARYIKVASLTDSLGMCIGIENWPRVAPGYCTYITREDRLYAFLNDSLQLLDQNFFQFTQKYCYFLEWILIDQNGKIVTTNPQRITKRYNPSDPAKANLCSSHLDEYPIPEKKTTPPTTNQAYTPTPKKFTWKQHDKNNPNEWFLYNGSNQLLYPESFEYPMNEYLISGGVFKQKGKYGYFDANYNKRLGAEYDFIYPYIPLTLKNGLWQLHDLASEKVSEGFDQISLNKLHELRFVFHEGKIGLLNDSLQLEIPLTDSIEFLAKYDLVALLYPNGSGKSSSIQNIRGIIYNGSPKEVYRQINNRIIIEQAYLNSTANDHLKFSPVDGYRTDIPYGLKNLVIYHNPYCLKKERRPTFYNSNFYSEMTLARSESLSNNMWDELGNSDLYRFKQFYNYKIIGNELVPITVNDILKTDANSTAKLNELMIRELNKIQAFGENCTDIEDKLIQLKEKFILNQSKITFYWAEIGAFEISLSYRELTDLLLFPNKITP